MGAGVTWGAWGISWLGSWGESWGPLHEVDDEPQHGSATSHLVMAGAIAAERKRRREEESLLVLCLI